MLTDTAAMIEKVKRDPEFYPVVKRRTRLAWVLSAVTLAVYFGFILLVAFAPGLLARPIGDGTMTVGIAAGVGTIVLAVALTGFYAHRANSDFDARIDSIVARAAS
ncbi:membrane protein [Hyphomicrobium nitrativorans NL23]|uniref:Membrane protein n=1 Tax=Hyphomicrobium nitrativorans NL23 TaxID=1029756 RepID=V5SCF0_9HYPH|nr:DUF485 domain-containing protein [Hyphomicrobium nitrativorans]AHB48566.1 membrane protein [Hyphomicrobium nitrativorans NL23]